MYQGQTYAISLEQSGFSANKNIDVIPPTALVHPSRNIFLNEGGVRKRPGTARVDSSTMGAVGVTGLFDFTLATETQFIVRATDDGKLWKDMATTIKTGWTANKKVHISQITDEVIFCNGADLPTVWDGDAASTTDLTNVPADWKGTNYPQQMIQHGSGNSVRNWALGCPENPKTIYITPDGSPKDFTQSTVLTLNIETGDGFGIVGGIEFGDRLVLFGKTRSFLIDDLDTDTNNWGYSEAQWVGGAAHHRLIVRTPNDIVCMMENGEIYSATVAETYGDYKAASLTRPSFMHDWIKTYVKLSSIADFHAVYDPSIRAIKFFVVGIGGTECNTVLCYFIDRPPDKAWVILDNQDYESGYAALSSCIARRLPGVWNVYTGSYNGRVWKLGEATQSDNGNAYTTSAKFPLLTFDNPRQSKRYDNVRIISPASGSCEATLKWWIDNTYIDEEALTFNTTGEVLGTFLLGTDTLGGTSVLEMSVRIGQVGKRLQVELENTSTGDCFFSQLLFDFIPLGSRP